MKTVSVIGLGRAGGAIALSLPPAKYRLEHLVYRGRPPRFSGPGIVTDALIENDRVSEITSEIVFLTTQDREIGNAARSLQGRLRGYGVIYHTCGAMPSSVLAELRTAERSIGSIHPLVSISDPALGPERLRGAYFCIEGDEKAVEIGEELVDDLGHQESGLYLRFRVEHRLPAQVGGNVDQRVAL